MLQTSLEAWGIIARDLGEKQFDIFYKLAQLGPSTNGELAAHYGIAINRITPRIYELHGMGLVRLVTIRQCKVTTFRARVWAVAEYEQAIDQFKRYLSIQKIFKEKGEVQKEFFV